MALSVRKKIWLGTGFLFVLLVLTGTVSIYHTWKLKGEAQEILKDNYESLGYCHRMQQQLDSMQAGYTAARNSFAAELALQEQNETEQGEQEATVSLRQHFRQWQQGDTSAQNIQSIRQTLQQILALNMTAISDKNQKAAHTAATAMAMIIGLAGLVFLIAFTFSLNFPSVVTTPISHLQEAIRQISNKNYNYRIHIDNKDEFGSLADAFNGMTERLEYFESSNLNKILFEKSRAEAVINSLKDASIGIDKGGLVLFANQQALQLLHLDAAEVIGKPVTEISRRNDLFDFLLQQETAAPFKIVVDGREHYFTRETIEVAQGDNHSKVIVLKNITPFKELDVAKTHFIATISHELKTPLAASDLSLKLLEDERNGHLSADQKELLQSLKEDNQRMLRILSELLNMAQVETGRIQLQLRQADPRLMVTDAMQTVAAAARDKGIVFEVQIAADIPMVQADAEKTTWVLNNFLGNAIKYAPEQSKVNISVRRSGEEIVFAVADQGPGVPEAFRSQLFGRYFQVPGSPEKGTGLGLSISKEFIEAQGGRVWLGEEPGAGAVFCFSLPADLSR